MYSLMNAISSSALQDTNLFFSVARILLEERDIAHKNIRTTVIKLVNVRFNAWYKNEVVHAARW